MKVRIAYTVDISDSTRRAINAYYGRPGLASHKQIVEWFKSFGYSMHDDLSYYAPDSEQ